MPRSFNLVVLLCLVVAAFACGGGQGQSGPGGGAGRGAFPPMDVKTIALEPRPTPQSSEFVATIRSLRSTTVQPQVEGIARQIFVRAGDHVNVGQPLVQIDPDKQQATVTAAESQRASREAELAFARQQLARMQKLHEAGAVSSAELEQAETAFKNAEAQLAAVQALIQQDQVELQYYRVTAPSAGIVGEIPIRQGDRLTPSTLITTIDQPEGLEAYINVPLERAGQLKAGLLVELVDSDGAVIASNPVSVPFARVNVVGAIVSPLLKVIVPNVEVRVLPMLVSVDVGENVTVPFDMLVVPVTL